MSLKNKTHQLDKVLPYRALILTLRPGRDCFEFVSHAPPQIATDCFQRIYDDYYDEERSIFFIVWRDGRCRRWSLSFTNASPCQRRQSSTQHESFLNWSSLPLISCCQLSKRLRAVSSSLS